MDITTLAMADRRAEERLKGAVFVEGKVPAIAELISQQVVDLIDPPLLNIIGSGVVE